MLFYSLKEIADLLGAEPVVIWDALHATKVKMTFAGRDAARPTFGLWSEVRDAPNPDYKRPTDPLITTELIEYAGLKPDPSHITILVDHLPATWQSRLREARMAQMRAGQGTPEYQRDEADVEAAVKRLDDAKVNLAMMTEALANAPKTGDVEKIRSAQAAVEEAQQDVDQAQAAIERLRGYDPLTEEAAFVDGVDSVRHGHELEDVISSTSDAPSPLTTGDIAHCFDGLRWNEMQWRRPLGDKPKWLLPCIVIPGQQGVRETHWNPVLIGAALVRNGHVQARSVRARFQTKPQLAPWLEVWETYEVEYIDTD